MGTNGEVLVMDLCTGGSLYSMLDDPENAFGVEEEEFLSVLHDVGESGVTLLQYSIYRNSFFVLNRIFQLVILIIVGGGI